MKGKNDFFFQKGQLQASVVETKCKNKNKIKRDKMFFSLKKCGVGLCGYKPL
jgi:hypothetical protein